MRCPYCGDSKKSESKARGWIFYSKDHSATKYHCHNCGKDTKFEYFLKDQDYNLYAEYLKDRMLDGSGNTTIPSLKKKVATPVIPVTKPIALKSIDELKENHPARVYVTSRAIPESRFNELYYTPKFKTWVNTLIPNKFEYTKKDEPRLIIPLLNEEGKMFGFQGRSFKPNDPLKYIAILLDEKMPKIYGLHKLDKTKRVYVFEGCIDSIFIPNSVAVCQGNLLSVKKILSIDQCIFVPDRDIRNKEIMNSTSKIIKEGGFVCLLPPSLIGNDINSIILKDKLSSSQILKLIDDNTYQGLKALLHFKMRYNKS